jgi:maltose O-acetyltransferase
VWIGDRVLILKGSEIGEGCVVAAGAVVSGKFPPDVLIGGVPAKIIRTLPENRT